VRRTLSNDEATRVSLDLAVHCRMCLQRLHIPGPECSPYTIRQNQVYLSAVGGYAVLASSQFAQERFVTQKSSKNYGGPFE